jgi:hypothetical protein
LDEAADEDEKAAPPKDGSIDRVYPFLWPPRIFAWGVQEPKFSKLAKKPKMERRGELLLDKNP